MAQEGPRHVVSLVLLDDARQNRARGFDGALVLGQAFLVGLEQPVACPRVEGFERRL